VCVRERERARARVREKRRERKRETSVEHHWKFDSVPTHLKEHFVYSKNPLEEVKSSRTWKEEISIYLNSKHFKTSNKRSSLLMENQLTVGPGSGLIGPDLAWISLLIFHSRHRTNEESSNYESSNTTHQMKRVRIVPSSNRSKFELFQVQQTFIGLT